jgi:hypothetical protein
MPANPPATVATASEVVSELLLQAEDFEREDDTTAALSRIHEAALIVDALDPPDDELARSVMIAWDRARRADTARRVEIKKREKHEVESEWADILGAEHRL